MKLLIGVASFAIIYFRLRYDLTPDRLQVLANAFASWHSLAALAVCILLIPVNWGIESYKWQLITAPVEKISYATATRSVYSGVCVGNLAPARATEFLAKIIYFDIANRPQVTVLHFVSGLFQLSITVAAGFAALFFYLNDLLGSASWLIYVTASIGAILLVALVAVVIKIGPLLQYLSNKIARGQAVEKFSYRFSKKLIVQMAGYSLLRYIVFYAQYALLLHLFLPFGPDFDILAGIALYFLVAATVPMISVIEAAIRTAIALVVFKNADISAPALALSSVLLWLVNIILPSLAGYVFLLRQNFNFKLFRSSR